MPGRGQATTKVTNPEFFPFLLHEQPYCAGRADTYGAGAAGGQSSIGEVWGAQVREHQEGVAGVGGAFKKPPILLSSDHWGEKERVRKLRGRRTGGGGSACSTTGPMGGTKGLSFLLGGKD